MTSTTNGRQEQRWSLDVVQSYPPTELLKLLANILIHIASTNDHLHDEQHHHYQESGGQEQHQHPPIWHTLTTATRVTLLQSSPLSFHARNIPTISLESYLLRILKYCPTSNFVFLSLLVYFDRMSKLTLAAVERPFVIDSYNVHRLVMAGVTVASKFFSDVFYTNSRYAKVGGLPLHELNQLELQFLLLNDFRLVVSPDDMQDYAEQLIRFSHSFPSPPTTSLRLPDVSPRSNGHHHRRTSTTNITSSLPPSSSPSPSSSPPQRPIPTNAYNHRAVLSDSDSEDPASASPSPSSDDDDEDEDDNVTEADTDTIASSTSTDDSEPTVRGPSTVVGWNGSP